MKLYEELVRCDVRLPRSAIDAIDDEARRTGIQRAVFLRHIVMRWIGEDQGVMPNVDRAGTDQAAAPHGAHAHG